MDELKSFLKPYYIIVMVLIICVLTLIEYGMLANAFKDEAKRVGFIVFVGVVEVFSIVFLIYALIKYLIVLKRIQNTPESQDQIIEDFHEAEWFWDGQIRIGKINIYKEGDGFFPRNKGMYFFYQKHFDPRLGASYLVYLVGPKGKKKILERRASKCSEKEIYYEVDRANNNLRKTGG